MQRLTFEDLPQDKKHQKDIYIHDLEDLDRRSWLQRGMSHVSSYVRYGVRESTRIIRGRERITVSMDDPSGKVGLWGSNTSCLYIFLHGLGTNGMTWVHYAQALKEEDPNCAIYVPTMIEELKTPATLADDIMAYINSLLQDVPLLKIGIISFSHGARVACELERRFCARGKSVLFISIAGLLYGTRWVDMFNWTCWFCGKSMALQNMGYGNDESRETIQKMREGRPDRRFVFIVSMDDERIHPPRASVPYLGIGEIVYVAYGLLHEELFDASKQIVIDECLNYMSDESNFEIQFSHALKNP